MKRKPILPRARRSREVSMKSAGLGWSLERQKCSIRREKEVQEKALFPPDYKYGLDVPESSCMKDWDGLANPQEGT